ncbi:FAD-dependent oxidoreductase [Halalkalibacillus halophilus]|uniref:FAD-dependent oxidoreductase n=1 Tax=Halalkalibacillus halophilus TaxID=392827 RepID=UPI000408556F|nr:FAD-dependent oxidoreductase [Halalkalibacillus halophilus]
MRYVIIGGDAAGMSAAMQITRNKSENDEVITLERGNIYSYGQCGLPYVVSGTVESTEAVIARSIDFFREKAGIDARVFHEVTNVDVQNQIVSGTILDNGESFQVHYDRLLIATGVKPKKPEWEGNELDGIFTLKTIPDTENIMHYLRTTEASQATIIGGGFIGLELAENLIERGLHVRIIQRGSQLMNPLDEDMANLLLEEAKNHNIEVIFDESVEAFEGEGAVSAVRTDQGTYQTDIAFVNVGITPNTGFLPSSLHKGDRHEIITNSYMETNIANIYAAGDCATQYHLIKQKNDLVPLGTHANKQGMVAGLNMSGTRMPFPGIVGASILKFCGLDIGRTGISEKEARELGFDCTSVTKTSNPVANYYDETNWIKIKLIYENSTKRLLGGQVIGTKGVDKRLDVISTCLYQGLLTTDLLLLDLSYAPPFNSVWDPLQQTAKKTL